jgi:hypothetical protein
MAGMDPHAEATHSDILVAITSLKERLEAMERSFTRQGLELDKACERLREAEKRLAQVMAVAVLLSIVMPILVNMSNIRVQVGAQNPELRR